MLSLRREKAQSVLIEELNNADCGAGQSLYKSSAPADFATAEVS